MISYGFKIKDYYLINLMHISSITENFSIQLIARQMTMSNNNIPPNIDSWCRTKSGEEINFSFAWTIENFSQRKEKNDEVIFFFRIDIKLLMHYFSTGVKLKHIHHSRT